jgi:acyl-CoA synthetase (AMP-forming)/AMP-acid ligase II
MPPQPQTATTLLDCLAWHAARTPDRLAYKFLPDSGEPYALTYRQLQDRVRGLAIQFHAVADVGDRALLLYPPGLEFIAAFLGCLAAGVVAVPTYPPRRNRKIERVQGIMADCTPRLVLTTSSVLTLLDGTWLQAAGITNVLATDTVEAREVHTRPLPELRPEMTAYLQYTSGSTGTPKGVIITHGNIISNEVTIQHNSGYTPDSVMTCWLPLFHDFGLIGGVLQPLFVGFPSILFSPTSFVQEPVRWLRAVTDYRVTTTGAPNFAYEHCVRRITDEQKRGLDLSSLKVMKNGAEPVRAETLDRFAEAFAGCGFRPAMFLPCYGLAEATLFVSGGPPEDPPRRLWVGATALEAGRVEPAPVATPGARCLVSCGRLGYETRVVVADPEARAELPPGRVGEVWVKSAGVGRGYWNRPDDTRDTFQNYLAGGDGPFLRTGDFGFLDGGELFVTGRGKDLIIIRGRNIYPQDVEALVERVIPFAEPNGCAAFGAEADGEERLAVAVEADRELVRAVRAAEKGRAASGPSGPEGPPPSLAALDALIDRLRQAVRDELEVSVHAIAFVRPGAFPRTSSGKVQRRACREGLLDGTLDVVHKWRAD